MKKIIKLIAVLILLLPIIAFVLSFLITATPPRYLLNLTPKDFDIPFERIEFQTVDGLTLIGWLIVGHERKPTVIIAHGLGAAKEDVLPKAPFLHKNGYSVFLFDFRGHGESDAGKFSFGYHEKQDVLAAIDFLKSRTGISQQFILWGLSLGAASSILAAAESEDVKGVISESSFDSLKDTIAHHAKLFFFLPKFPIVSLTVWIAEWRVGFDFDEVDIVNSIAKLSPRPVFIINGNADRRMPPKVAERLFEAAGEPKRIWHVPGAAHAQAFFVEQNEYQERVLEFLEEFRTLTIPED